MAPDIMDAAIDDAVEESFPASDPPSYMAGTAIAGSPRQSAGARPLPSDEPLNNEPSANERRTRERAYFLWELEGRPEGRADEHWRQAQREEANHR